MIHRVKGIVVPLWEGTIDWENPSLLHVEVMDYETWVVREVERAYEASQPTTISWTVEEEFLPIMNVRSLRKLQGMLSESSAVDDREPPGLLPLNVTATSQSLPMDRHDHLQTIEVDSRSVGPPELSPLLLQFPQVQMY